MIISSRNSIGSILDAGIHALHMCRPLEKPFYWFFFQLCVVCINSVLSSDWKASLNASRICLLNSVAGNRIRILWINWKLIRSSLSLSIITLTRPIHHVLTPGEDAKEQKWRRLPDIRPCVRTTHRYIPISQQRRQKNLCKCDLHAARWMQTSEERVEINAFIPFCSQFKSMPTCAVCCVYGVGWNSFDSLCAPAPCMIAFKIQYRKLMESESGDPVSTRLN